MLVYSAVVNTDIQLVFVGLETEFYDLGKNLDGTVFSIHKLSLAGLWPFPTPLQ